MILKKTDFKNRKSAPANYIAGLARGDTGFLTGLDMAVPDDAKLAKLKAAVEVERKQLANPNSAPRGEFVVDETDFDRWSGFKSNLFKSDKPSKEDEEADRFFDSVEERVAHRRTKRVKTAEEPPQSLRPTDPTENPNPRAAFQQEKEALKGLTAADWLGIADCVPGAVKKLDKTKYTPVADSLLTLHLKRDARTWETEGRGPGQFGETGAEPLGSGERDEETPELHDTERARILMKSACQSDPNNAELWVARAKLEEECGGPRQARTVLEEATVFVGDNVEVWKHLIRLTPKADRPLLYSKGISQSTEKTELWLMLAAEQSSDARREEVLQQAIQRTADKSQTLPFWRNRLELHPGNGPIRQQLLAGAVECCPGEADLWVEWAFASPPGKARQILNKANKEFRNTNIQIWVAAAVVEESAGQAERVAPILQKGLKKFSESGGALLDSSLISQITRECESRGSFGTLRGFLEECLALASADRPESLNELTGEWVKLAQQSAFQSKTLAIFARTCVTGLGKKGLVVPDELFEVVAATRGELTPENSNESWTDAFFHARMTLKVVQKFLDCLGKDFQSRILGPDSFFELVEKSLKAVSQVNPPETRDRMIRKILEALHWFGEDPQATSRLCRAFPELPLCRLKDLESRICIESGELGEEMREEMGQLLGVSDPLLLLEAARLQSTWLRKLGKVEENGKFWTGLIQRHPQNVGVRIAAAESHFLDGQGQLGRGTYAPVVDSGKLGPSEWLDILDLESKNLQTVRNLAQKASKRFPNHPSIRVREAELFPETMKTRVQELAKLFPQSSEVCILVAKVFRGEAKRDKTKAWLLKALEAEPQNADAKGYLALFEAEGREEAVRRFKEAGPPTGDRFLRFQRRHLFWGATGRDKDRLFSEFIEWLGV